MTARLILDYCIVYEHMMVSNVNMNKLIHSIFWLTFPLLFLALLVQHLHFTYNHGLTQKQSESACQLSHRLTWKGFGTIISTTDDCAETSDEPLESLFVLTSDRCQTVSTHWEIDRRVVHQRRRHFYITTRQCLTFLTQSNHHYNAACLLSQFTQLVSLLKSSSSQSHNWRDKQANSISNYNPPHTHTHTHRDFLQSALFIRVTPG